MSGPAPKTSLFFYVPVIFLAGFILFWVVSHEYEKGMTTGSLLPPPPETKKASAVDLRALASDAGLAAKGKTLYMTNCASCHGASGTGDGDRAASLNPKPRNYTTEKFKFGDDVVSIFHTLEKGSPGTSMPSFVLLPPEDLMAMAHFVRTLVPNATPTSDEILNKLPASTGGGSATASTPAATTDSLSKGPGQRIPIELAMRVSERKPMVPAATASTKSQAPGAALFLQKCARCHGNSGEGVQWKTIAVAPYRYELTGSLKRPDAAWASDRARFAEIVTNGLPGDLMPGFGTLSSTQLDALHSYSQTLR